MRDWIDNDGSRLLHVSGAYVSELVKVKGWFSAPQSLYIAQPGHSHTQYLITSTVTGRLGVNTIGFCTGLINVAHVSLLCCIIWTAASLGLERVRLYKYQFV